MEKQFEFELTGTIHAESYDEAVTAVVELTSGEPKAGRIEAPSLELDGREVPLERWRESVAREEAAIG